MPFGNFGPKAIVKMRSRGIAGRMRQVIRPDSSSHQPEMKRPIGSEKTATLMRVIGSVADPGGGSTELAGVGRRAVAAPMTTSVTSSPTVAERPE